MNAHYCRLCLNTDPSLSFSPMEVCLDLVTFTLGSLDLNINPTLGPSLLCKALETKNQSIEFMTLSR